MANMQTLSFVRLRLGLGMINYEFHCPFCRNIHLSPYWDELEESILRCRDAAPEDTKGLVRHFRGDTSPISVEVSMAIAEQLRVQAEAYGSSFV